jgi:hypothetical protein
MKMKKKFASIPAIHRLTFFVRSSYLDEPALYLDHGRARVGSPC